MPLSEKARIEVFLPDVRHPAYAELRDTLETEFSRAFGGCSLVTRLQGSYLARAGAVIRDRVNLLFTDTPFTFAANFATLSHYVDNRDRNIETVWKMPIGGSDAFAVDGDHALFRGGYKDRDTYQLFSLGPNEKVKLETKIQLCDRDGTPLTPNWVVGRGDAICLISDNLLYRVEVQAAATGN